MNAGLCIGGPLHGQSAAYRTLKFKVQLLHDASVLYFGPSELADLNPVSSAVEYTFDSDLDMWLFEGVVIPKKNLRREC